MNDIFEKNNFEIYTMQKTAGTVQTVNGCLYQLGWNWQHPRVKAYLDAVAAKYCCFPWQRLEDVPPKALLRLTELLGVYSACNKLLKLLRADYTHPICHRIYQKYGYENFILPLAGWKELYELLEEEWFMNGGGF